MGITSVLGFLGSGVNVAKDVVKNVGKAFIDIGKDIAQVTYDTGKFFGEVAVTGTLGMLNALPGIGGALADGLVAGTSALFGEDSFVTQGVTSLMEFSKNVGSTAVNTFRTITTGVADTINNFSGTAAKKLGLDAKGASDNFFGPNSAFDKSFGDKSKFKNLTKTQEDVNALTKAFDSAAKSDPALNIDLTPFDVDNLGPSSIDLSSNVAKATAEPINLESTIGLGKETLGQAVGLDVAGAAKPSLLQRGYEGAKKSVKRGVVAAKDAAIKQITDAPETLLTEYVSGKIRDKIYGTPEAPEAPDYGSSYAGYASGNVVQANTIQSRSSTLSADQFMRPYQPRSGSWGYNATQSNVYGQRMSQLYKPQNV